ncbi:hypothetical protein STEG23_000874, partial [Scotinomys teguina]
ISSWQQEVEPCQNSTSQPEISSFFLEDFGQSARFCFSEISMGRVQECCEDFTGVCPALYPQISSGFGRSVSNSLASESAWFQMRLLPLLLRFRSLVSSAPAAASLCRVPCHMRVVMSLNQVVASRLKLVLPRFSTTACDFWLFSIDGIPPGSMKPTWFSVQFIPCELGSSKDLAHFWEANLSLESSHRPYERETECEYCVRGTQVQTSTPSLPGTPHPIH